MKILALDPGNERTGWVQFHDGEIIAHGIDLNEAVRQYLALVSVECDVLAIENIASYGMPVGEEVFSTCRWIGRFVECWVGTCGNSESSVRLLPRKEIKIHLCGTAKANDGNIRQRLLDLLGPQGTKKAPGPTYGIRSHEWAALAVAVTASQT